MENNYQFMQNTNQCVKTDFSKKSFYSLPIGIAVLFALLSTITAFVSSFFLEELMSAFDYLFQDWRYIWLKSWHNLYNIDLYHFIGYCIMNLISIAIFSVTFILCSKLYSKFILKSKESKMELSGLLSAICSYMFSSMILVNITISIFTITNANSDFFDELSDDLYFSYTSDLVYILGVPIMLILGTCLFTFIAAIIITGQNPAESIKLDNSNENKKTEASEKIMEEQIIEAHQDYSEKGKTATALLCFFLGEFGIHRFYVGKIGTGILWLFTLGLGGIGSIVDFIIIICGNFKDSKGKKIK